MKVEEDISSGNDSGPADRGLRFLPVPAIGLFAQKPFEGQVEMSGV
jgi:hypothetical protein